MRSHGTGAPERKNFRKRSYLTLPHVVVQLGRRFVARLSHVDVMRRFDGRVGRPVWHVGRLDNRGRLRNLSTSAMVILWPIAELVVGIEDETGSALDVEGSLGCAYEILCAALWAGIKPVTLVKTVERTGVVKEWLF